ncbi:flagellar hook capping FlgD N-terminal domain-containing protein [Tropicimonas isoalkanivorans]|uniref:Basal-body rod modification protein FlgD n=1 Tax=Tropicimonas isoalkanivorans TaxID=441112 RepID=A0A1I1Q8N7_9RHOB|nr:flagellar hook capping FlgD N-terminal domain-containing protein [Tropicimonas isoalkanivorans]SFD18435.1 flagellar basal-body rod modification protein FlgD [Tropicimonas isoalkanivorans]
MDAISDATSVSPSASSKTSSTASDKGVVSSDFETFLKMMTAQIENQDPLNPLDATDFATQLATFSGVEQQVKTNELLSALRQDSGAMDLSRLADWVGTSVRVPADAAFEGEPVDLWVKPLEIADHAQLVIKDGQGKERNRIALSMAEGPLEWTGVDSKGANVAWGNYTFDVESYDKDGDLLATEPAQIYADVIEARSDGASTLLVLKGGQEVSSDSVTAVRGVR